MTKDFNPSEWITTSEAAELMGYARAYFWQLIKRGRLSGRKLERDWFLKKDDVLAHAKEMNRPESDEHNPWRTEARRKDNGAG